MRIDLILIEWYVVQRELGLLALEMVEEGEFGLTEDLGERKEGLVNIAGFARHLAYGTGHYHDPSAVKRA